MAKRAKKKGNIQTGTVPYRIYSAVEIEEFLKEDGLSKNLARKLKKKSFLNSPSA